MCACTSTGKHWRKITRCLTNEEIHCPPQHGNTEPKEPLPLVSAVPTQAPRPSSESQSTPRIPAKDSVLTPIKSLLSLSKSFFCPSLLSGVLGAQGLLPER